ncbi:MAG: hypothetical protein MUE73_10395 [Planctomycetes bacterium]|nr:hypothetical protein [Planctomycetota bacterium]
MNAVLNAIGAVLVGAVSWAPPWLRLGLIALVLAVPSLLLVRATVNRGKVRAAKRRVRADLMGVLLFRREPIVAVKSLLAAFLGSLANLRFVALPMALLLVPFALLFVQLDLRLGHRAFRPGERVVLRAHLADAGDLDGVAVESAEGVVVETPLVRVEDAARDLREVDFRVRITEGPRHVLRLRCGDAVEEKRFAVSDVPAMTFPRRPGPGLPDRLLYPGEPALPAAGPFAAFETVYPTEGASFVWIDWPWWLLFLAFFLLFLFVLRRPLRAEF